MLDLSEKSGLLEQAIEVTSRAALACGALQPIETNQEIISDAGVEFLVRSVSSLRRKAQAGTHQIREMPDGFDPFLPPEAELTVAQISATHLAILNKFNVIDGHLLIVTRHFEDQERLLSDDDFQALWRCLQEIDGLGFYNGGKVAGASQRHKHLQLVPLPLRPGIRGTPMDRLWPEAFPAGEPVMLPALPFRHLFMALPDGLDSETEEAARYCLDAYLHLLGRLGIKSVIMEDGERQSAPYNLLLTRRWMLLTPRSRESWQGVSINALGFAGSLFVPDRAAIEQIRLVGPMNILQAVTST